MGLDLAVALHASLTGQAQFLLIAESGEERQGTEQESHFLKQSLLADLVLTVDDIHAATGALSQTTAVQVSVRTAVEFDAVFEGLLAEVSPVGNLDFPLLVDKCHFRHDVLTSG